MQRSNQEVVQQAMGAKLFYRFLCGYDALWRRMHKVEKIDELISLSFVEFTGEARAMNDGTWLNHGDRLAILHFNRQCFTNLDSGYSGAIRNAFRFRKLLKTSLARLAQRINKEERFLQIKAFHGVSWLPAHGEKLGFMIEPMQDSLRNNIRKFYFFILLRTFFPNIIHSKKQPINPNAYWLTRQNLIKYFPSEIGND